jgi:hypothetical protein
MSLLRKNDSQIDKIPANGSNGNLGMYRASLKWVVDGRLMVKG